MQGSNYPIEMQQGSTFQLQLTIKDADGNVRDLTDCNLTMQIRSTYAAATAAETLSSANGEIDVAAAQGKANITLTAARTAAIKVDLASKKPPKSIYVYDLELVDENGISSKLLYGDVTVYGEVTR
jgi:hypothetical protein